MIPELVAFTITLAVGLFVLLAVVVRSARRADAEYRGRHRAELDALERMHGRLHPSRSSSRDDA